MTATETPASVTQRSSKGKEGEREWGRGQYGSSSPQGWGWGETAEYRQTTSQSAVRTQRGLVCLPGLTTKL